MEFINIYPNTFEFENKEDNNVNNIPRILHLIWVGDKEEPPYLMENINKWIELLPNWEIMLWKNNDLTTKHFPLNIIYLLDKVKKGAQKADIMRYFIIKKYGGVYMDSDITPYRSLEPIITKLPHTEAILCHDLDVTWYYIINAFFAAIPNHPIFISACELCNSAIINTEDIHMHTGPRLLGDAVSKTNLATNTVILPTKFFYRNLEYDGRFGNHFYAKEW